MSGSLPGFSRTLDVTVLRTVLSPHLRSQLTFRHHDSRLGKGTSRDQPSQSLRPVRITIPVNDLIKLIAGHQHHSRDTQSLQIRNLLDDPRKSSPVPDF